MTLDELTQPGWGDAADYLSERATYYSAAELKVTAVVMPQTDSIVATPSQTTIRELMQSLDIVPRQSRMPHRTCRPGSSQMRLGSGRPQSQKRIALPDSSLINKLKPVDPVSFYSYILPA